MKYRARVSPSATNHTIKRGTWHIIAMLRAGVLQVPVKVGDQYLPMSINILDKCDVDMLFGLDMLRRYRSAAP